MAPKLSIKIALEGIALLLSNFRRIGRAAHTMGRMVGTAFHGITRLARTAAKGIGLLSIGFLAVTGFSARAAGRLEMLRLRLRTVTGSAEEAAKLFKDVFQLSIKTPFTPEELAESAVLLKAYGLDAERDLKAVAAAAATMGSNVNDVALAVGSLETEPIRRLTIEFEKLKEKGTFAFKDKLGKDVTLLADGILDMRKTLVRALEMRFGGNLEEASQTFEGLMSTVKGNISIAGAAFGERILPILKNIIRDMNVFLAKISGAGGPLERAGDRLAGIITEVRNLAHFLAEKGGAQKLIDAFMPAFETVRNIIYQAFVDGATKAGEILVKSGPRVFFRGTSAAVSASPIGERQNPVSWVWFKTLGRRPRFPTEGDVRREPETVMEKYRRIVGTGNYPHDIGGTAAAPLVPYTSKAAAIGGRIRGMLTGNEVSADYGDFQTRLQLAAQGLNVAGKPDGTASHPINVNIQGVTEDVAAKLNTMN